MTGSANTTQTASTEVPDIDINLAQTVQWATGALTTQRAVKIQPPTLGFVGASNAGSWPDSRLLHGACADIRWIRDAVMRALGIIPPPEPDGRPAPAARV